MIRFIKPKFQIYGNYFLKLSPYHYSIPEMAKLFIALLISCGLAASAGFNDIDYLKFNEMLPAQVPRRWPTMMPAFAPSAFCANFTRTNYTSPSARCNACVNAGCVYCRDVSDVQPSPFCWNGEKLDKICNSDHEYPIIDHTDCQNPTEISSAAAVAILVIFGVVLPCLCCVCIGMTIIYLCGCWPSSQSRGATIHPPVSTTAIYNSSYPPAVDAIPIHHPPVVVVESHPDSTVTLNQSQMYPMAHPITQPGGYKASQQLLTAIEAPNSVSTNHPNYQQPNYYQSPNNAGVNYFGPSYPNNQLNYGNFQTQPGNRYQPLPVDNQPYSGQYNQNQMGTQQYYPNTTIHSNASNSGEYR